MITRCGVVAAVVLALGAGTREAAADEPGAGLPEGQPLAPAFFFDTDATLFFWAPLAATFAVDTYVSSRSAPLIFDASEGGEESRRENEVPGVALSIGGALVAGGIALGDDPSRYHHAKGLAQSLATSGLLAVSAKRVFGRHRPDYDASAPSEDGQRSFPSGHTTRALASITYTALYLRLHGFDQWRKPGTLPWWEVASYVGLGGLAVGFAGERVYHNRHHTTDVIAGGLLGAASSTAFFIYNERKYRRSRKAATVDSPAEARDLFSDGSADSPSLPAFDGPMMSFGGSF